MADTFPVDPQRAGRRVYIQNRPDSGVFEMELQGLGSTSSTATFLLCSAIPPSRRIQGDLRSDVTIGLTNPGIEGRDGSWNAL